MPYINFEQLVRLEETIAPNDRPFCWYSVGRSHAGRQRNLNEDAFLNAPERGLWAVADGMGGLARGDYASGVVAESLLHFSGDSSLSKSIMNIEVKLREAHAICRNTFHGERVGSTVAALFAYGSYGFFLWAGDSRIYRLRNAQLTQMTQDHTVAQDKCARGELRPSQVPFHPSAHVLTRAVGVHHTLHLDLQYAVIEPGDRYLLCSDGLYNELAFNDIERSMGGSSVDDAVKLLIDHALDRGGRDNITAIILEARSAQAA